MKKCFLLSMLLVSLISLQAQNADSLWVRENYYKIERMVPMRDGTKLFTAFYIPKDSSEKHPILFNRTPYSCSPYGEDKFSGRLLFTYWVNYLKEGYIIAIQDVRGKWMSEGEFMDIRPFNPAKKGTETDEASDTYDAIDWMINNIPSNNKRVGVFGISYPGFYSTMAALSGHPALKAVSPQAPVTEWFMGDDFHHNGAFFLMDGFSFYSGFGKPRPKPTTQGSPGYQFKTQDNYDFYLRTGALKNFAKIMGDSIAFWKDLYAHPNYDDWWKARNPMNFVTNVKPAMLIVGGLFDAEDCYGAWNLYKAIEAKSKFTENKLVMGPWSHGGWGGRADGSYLGNVRFGSKTSEYYQRNIEIPFFNFYLKLRGTVHDIAEATIFFTGENEWRNMKQWPPKEITSMDINLVPGENLALEIVHRKFGKYSEYISDPAHPVPYTEDVHLGRTAEYMTDDQRFASRRTDVLTFSTDVLSEDITVAGPVIADLVTSISTTDADFVVKIIDVFPDTFRYENNYLSARPGTQAYPMGGYQMLVRGEIMRGRYRNSFEKPEAFKPNERTNVKFTLPDIAHTFKKGHKLMIQVQSSWFPLADRNPQKFVNIYTCDDSDFQKATIRIYDDSKIILPVLK
ncbi:MAG TPA: CocE/NonD family hydrolase [Ferruginibacter sp.]|nr:CocE/NonD family hydrolase [Ferruginibacter sp.]HNJ29149.1 CocE/NonD family hydrolase [Ferruginibacter sp.]HNN72451.1 CocE/NonD family hydrolase [Ferruginibacter sp.]